MNSTALPQQIFNTVQRLPKSLQQEVLDFAAYLAQRTQPTSTQDWHDLQNAQISALRAVWDTRVVVVWNDA